MVQLKKAQKAISLATEKAQELGIAISVCVVDSAGNVIATARMDKALIISPKFAFAKAHTAALIGLPTGSIAEYAIPGKPYYGITTAFGGELTTIAGGVPIMQDNVVIGGIGVGGSTDVSQDALCAEAGLVAYSGE